MKKQTVMKQVLEQELKPIMISLFQRIRDGGLDLTMDGTPVYSEKAQFVAGKVINQACYTALELIGTEESLRELGDIIRMVRDMEMETWGIFNGIQGLYRLKKAGVLEKVVDPETLEILKEAFDWRTFVDTGDHYALISKPTNYYGVAFGIARHRELMGWEPECHSHMLLKRLIEHIDRYSGDLCFMDETPGDGRFDRYSILVPSELTSHLIGSGWEVPDKIRIMLRKATQIFLQIANEDGQGYAYGRSIGAYGDSAVVESLSAAAVLGGIMNEEETELAYAYSLKVMQRFTSFWYDRQMDSINMWNFGRQTDNYRNKNRILGENLSLCMQMVNSYEHWVEAGFEDHEICSDFSEKLQRLDQYTFIRFAQGEYDRGLAIVRDGKQVWSLPLINGARPYYSRDAYMPVPFQNNVLQGVPEHSHMQLVPQLITEEGELYAPISYIKQITPEIDQNHMSVTCEMDCLCHVRPDEKIPHKAEMVQNVAKYTFHKNRIHREDVFTFEPGVKIREVRLVMLTFSEQAAIDGCDVHFGSGVITGMHAEGYDVCSLTKAESDGSFDTPQGRLSAMVVWTKNNVSADGKLRLSWTIRYH